MTLAVTGLEKRVSTIRSASATLATADVRPTVAGSTA